MSTRTILIFDHQDGRTYCRVGGRIVSPAYAANDYIRYNDKYEKYGLWKYMGHLTGHNRVGAEPSFEKALDWLFEEKA